MCDMRYFRRAYHKLVAAKERLRSVLAKNCQPKDDFEWNVYYHVFLKKLD